METKMTKNDELLEGLTEDQQAAVEAEGRGLLSNYVEQIYTELFNAKGCKK